MAFRHGTVQPKITQRAFLLNPSPQEICVGTLEQLRRSKLTKIWKNVLVSVVKQGAIRLCIWRESVSYAAGMELLQEIPIASIQYVDEESEGGGSAFSIMPYDLEEGLLTFRSLDEPAAIRDWVATLRTVCDFVKKQKGGNSTAAPAAAATSSQPKENAEVDLLSFDVTPTTTPQYPTGFNPQQQHQPMQSFQQQQQQHFGQTPPQPQPQFQQQHQQQQPHLNYNGNQNQNIFRSASPTMPPNVPQGWQPQQQNQQQGYPYGMNTPSGQQPPPHQQQQYNNWQPNNQGQQTQTGYFQQRPSHSYPVQQQRPQGHQNHHHNHGRSLSPGPRPAIPRPTGGGGQATKSSQQYQQHLPHHRPQQPAPVHLRPARSFSGPPLKMTASARQEQIKKQVIVEWALQPPALQHLKSVAELIHTIQKVFPPRFTSVANHEYFSRWASLSNSNHSNNSNANSNDRQNTDSQLRKLKFFLHPDKLPKDFNDDQSFLCKLLWDIVNDAQQQQH